MLLWFHIQFLSWVLCVKIGGNGWVSEHRGNGWVSEHKDRCPAGPCCTHHHLKQWAQELYNLTCEANSKRPAVTVDQSFLHPVLLVISDQIQIQGLIENALHGAVLVLKFSFWAHPPVRAGLASLQKMCWESLFLVYCCWRICWESLFLVYCCWHICW